MKKLLVLTLILMMAVALSARLTLSAETKIYTAEETTAKFYVTCYDAGKSILSGLEGVKKVEKGSEGGREFNVVYYDPGVISEEEMINALKAQNVYVGASKLLIDK